MRRFFTDLLSLANLLAVALALGTVGCDNSDAPNLDGQLLVQALHAYHSDAVSKGESVPEDIPMVVLLERGLLTIDDLRPLEGYYVNIPSTNFALIDLKPETVIVRARNEAGEVVEVRADGSVVFQSTSHSP